LEAEKARLPVLVLSADRPWELSDARANQTLDQTRLFGRHVNAYFEVGVPEPAALAALPRIAARAVLAALSPRPGPVHINARFRKPLEPVAGDPSAPWRAEAERVRAQGAPQVRLPALTASTEAVDELVELCRQSQRSVLVAGPALGGDLRRRSAQLRRAVVRFARGSGAAVVAEATSGLLYGPESEGLVLGGADGWLVDALQREPPELLIEIGAPPTSARYLALARELCGTRRVVITDHGVPDPESTATHVLLSGSAAALLNRAADALRARDRAYAERLASAATQAPPSTDALSEPQLARRVLAALPAGATLMLSNSSVVRDFDASTDALPRDITVLHQRGLSGIDGLIAGAAGARSVLPADVPTVIVLGDVSTQHDIGSLALAARASAPLVVVVVANGGGRIFERLPVAERIDPELFKQLFITPPTARWMHAAAAFSISHHRVESASALDAALAGALARPGPTLLEAVTQRGAE
jgi:2-succinyl-5-enolpyruvyl-6-hydroxy-3-cyclohexene-1-carboxylate synthase